MSGSGNPVEIPTPEKSAGERDGCRKSTNKEDAVKKRPDRISENVRNQIWMCPGLSTFPNSEYVYAIFSTAVALFWGKGGRCIAESKPLSVIFTILTHCLDTSAVNNYFVRMTGKWSCGDTMAKGSAPLARLDDWERSTTGSNPRMV